jgi:hypothetical protein
MHSPPKITLVIKPILFISTERVKNRNKGYNDFTVIRSLSQLYSSYLIEN